MESRVVWIDNISDHVAVKAYLLNILSATQGYSYYPDEERNTALIIFVDKTDANHFLEKEHSLFTATMNIEAFSNIEANLAPECRSVVDELATNKRDELNLEVLQTEDTPNVIEGSLEQLKHFETTVYKLTIQDTERERVAVDTSDEHTGEYSHSLGDGVNSAMEHATHLKVFENVKGEVSPWISSTVSLTADTCDQIQERGDVTIKEELGKYYIHGSSLKHLQNTQEILFSLVIKCDSNSLSKTPALATHAVEDDIHQSPITDTGADVTHEASAKLLPDAGEDTGQIIDGEEKISAEYETHVESEQRFEEDGRENGSSDLASFFMVEDESMASQTFDVSTRTMSVEENIYQSSKSNEATDVTSDETVKLHTDAASIDEQLTDHSKEVSTDENIETEENTGDQIQDSSDFPSGQSFIVIEEPESSFVHVVKHKSPEEERRPITDSDDIDPGETPLSAASQLQQKADQDSSIPVSELDSASKYSTERDTTRENFTTGVTFSSSRDNDGDRQMHTDDEYEIPASDERIGTGMDTSSEQSGYKSDLNAQDSDQSNTINRGEGSFHSTAHGNTNDEDMDEEEDMDHVSTEAEDQEGTCSEEQSTVKHETEQTTGVRSTDLQIELIKDLGDLHENDIEVKETSPRNECTGFIEANNDDENNELDHQNKRDISSGETSRNASLGYSFTDNEASDLHNNASVYRDDYFAADDSPNSECVQHAQSPTSVTIPTEGALNTDTFTPQAPDLDDEEEEVKQDGGDESGEEIKSDDFTKDSQNSTEMTLQPQNSYDDTDNRMDTEDIIDKEAMEKSKENGMDNSRLKSEDTSYENESQQAQFATTDSDQQQATAAANNEVSPGFIDRGPTGSFSREEVHIEETNDQHSSVLTGDQQQSEAATSESIVSLETDINDRSEDTLQGDRESKEVTPGRPLELYSERQEDIASENKLVEGIGATPERPLSLEVADRRQEDVSGENNLLEITTGQDPSTPQEETEKTRGDVGSEISEEERDRAHTSETKPTMENEISSNEEMETITSNDTVDLAECLDKLEYHHKTPEGITVSIKLADITKADADVIVNAANTTLQHGGGVAKAIVRAGGKQIDTESRMIVETNGELPVCTVCHTTAGKMKSKYVLHAVAPVWRDDRENAELQLHVLLLKVFTYASTRLKVKSIAIPAIGAGLYGMPIEVCANIFHKAIREFSSKRDENALLEDIRIVLYDVEATGAFLIEFCNAVSTEPSSEPGAVLPETDPVLLTAIPPDASIPATLTTLTVMKPRGPSHLSKNVKSISPATDKASIAESLRDKGDCQICVDTHVKLLSMNCCRSTMCKVCFDRHFEHDGKCPFCTSVVLMRKGTQPDGEMDFSHEKNYHLPGYEKDGTIIIDYYFPGGIQKKCHPNPGKRYRGTRRRAFLPASGEGLLVLSLLKRAFDQRFVFTIGRSATTGMDDCVIWNDIHHKTSPDGGPANYGYPDPTYLDRIKAELAAKGFK